MQCLLRCCSLLSLSVLGVLACGDECLEPPGLFEPVEGCEVNLERGEDVFAFCVNPPGDGECGGPGAPYAQSWLASLQSLDQGEPTAPVRVGCGPVDPALVPNASPAPGDCCWLMVSAELDSENCVDTNL